MSLQGRDGIEIGAPSEAVWNLLSDSARLSEWSPHVRSTNGEGARLDGARIVEVQLGRRRGRVGERCVVFEPLKRIGWRIERDTFGVWKQIDFGVEFELEALEEGRSRVITKTYYRPRTILAKALGRLMLEPRLRRLRRAALANLRRLAEQEARDPPAAPGKIAGVVTSCKDRAWKRCCTAAAETR